jgi:potassium channel subfamily K, other eukaryote
MNWTIDLVYQGVNDLSRFLVGINHVDHNQNEIAAARTNDHESSPLLAPEEKTEESISNVNNHNNINNNNNTGSININSDRNSEISHQSIDEEIPLRADDVDPQSRSSLTDSYRQFEHSNQALYLLMFHVTLYYGAAIILFSCTTQHWSLIDSAYYATVVFTTIGFGDLSPDNLASQIATLILAGYGIIWLGIFLGILGDSLLKEHEQKNSDYRKRMQDGIVGAFYPNNPVRSSNPTTTLVDDGNFDSEAHCVTKLDWKSHFLKAFWRIAQVESPIVGFVVMGAMLIGYIEDWNMFQSLYWAGVSGATIGFGDLTPHTQKARLLCCLFLPLSVAATGKLMGRVASVYLDGKRKQVETQFLSRSMTLCDLKAMDMNNDGKVNRAEVNIVCLCRLKAGERYKQTVKGSSP